MTKGKTRYSSGITLIALVLTIIVLLILAGVSIAMLTGNNSILNQATTAKETTGKKQIEEKVSLAYNAAVMEDINNGKGSLQENTLSTELEKLFPGSTIDIDTTTDTTGKKWYVKIDDGTPIEVEAGKSTPQVAKLPTAAGTTPYYPSDKFTKVKDTDLTTGLVITDEVDEEENSIGNEYVWIEVPNKKLDSSATFGPDYAGNSVSGSTDYENIEKAMIAYVKDGLLNGSENTSENSDANNNSRYGWKDEWYDKNNKKATDDGADLTNTEGCGLTSEKYTELYHKMLKSVYENGGFWIGRYEAGTGTARQSGDSASGITPLSKIDQYPINFVTCSEAQKISESVQNIDRTKYTSSLMFGIQWDLVLRHLSNKGVATDLLTGNSETWGNYDLAYNLEQTTVHGFKGAAAPWRGPNITWSVIWNNYSHTSASYPNNPSYALSTGATTRNMKKNIYDLAGNMNESTLEHATAFSDRPCACRGGHFGYAGSEHPASSRTCGATSDPNFACRF